MEEGEERKDLGEGDVEEGKGRRKIIQEGGI